jgi:hypothetical protein
MGTKKTIKREPRPAPSKEVAMEYRLLGNTGLKRFGPSTVEASAPLRAIRYGLICWIGGQRATSCTLRVVTASVI